MRGKATCGLCRVKILAGEDALSPFNAAERKHLGNVYFITKTRLSCQAKVIRRRRGDRRGAERLKENLGPQASDLRRQSFRLTSEARRPWGASS